MLGITLTDAGSIRLDQYYCTQYTLDDFSEGTKAFHNTQKQHNNQGTAGMEETHRQTHRLADGVPFRILQEGELGVSVLRRQKDNGMEDTAEKRGQDQDCCHVQGHMA